MILERLYSPELKQWMKALVVLPTAYTRIKGTLPTVIVNDAQNAWTNRGSYGGWHIDSIAARLARRRRMPPVIIIGVLPPNWRDRVFGPPPRGQADNYTNFLADTLLPTLRRKYRITGYNQLVGIIGASFGANAALYSGLTRPDAFANIAAMSASPHFGKSIESMIWESRALSLRRLYVDCGTRWAYDDPYNFGGDNTAFNCGIMKACRYRIPRYKFIGRVCKGHFHNEEWWRKRLGRVLLHFFEYRER